GQSPFIWATQPAYLAIIGHMANMNCILLAVEPSIPLEVDIESQHSRNMRKRFPFFAYPHIGQGHAGDGLVPQLSDALLRHPQVSGNQYLISASTAAY